MTSAQPPSQPPVLKPRAWWQWVLGVTLLAGASAVLAVRYVAPAAAPVAEEWKPVPIRVPPELKTGDAISASPGELAGFNVLLVTFDTTRADRMGCYGNPRVQTPNVDRLAREGVLFSQAAAPAPVTLPSHTSMLTGLYPYRHGARANGIYRVGEEQVLLSEVLSERGYDTAAFISAFVLDARFGLSQGFSVYDDDLGAEPNDWLRPQERGGADTTRRALNWLNERSAEKPFFAWVHYFDPHAPYKPPSPYAEQYGFAYEGEIAFVDEQVGLLLDGLERAGTLDRTLVIVTADHGEGLIEHDEWTHGCLIYEATMRVPLVFWCRDRLGPGTHVPHPVSLVDIMPTVLGLVGVDPPVAMDGVDLTKPLRPDRPLFLETLEGWADYGFAALLGVREGSLKYIYGPDPEVYDLSTDPFEENNLIVRRPQEAAKLKQRLAELFGADLAQAAMGAPTHQMSPEEAARMRAVGYAGAGGGSTDGAALPDPKTMMLLKQQVETGMHADTSAELRKVLPKLEQLSAKHDVFIVYWYLSQAQLKVGQLDAAEETLRRCLHLRPDQPGALRALARLKLDQGNNQEALGYYAKLLESCPDQLVPLLDYADLLYEEGQIEEAATQLKRAFRVRPSERKIVEALVTTMRALGRTDECLYILREALQERPALAAACGAAAELLVQTQRPDEAIEMLRAGVAASPGEHDLANNLAILLVTQPDRSMNDAFEAASLMEAVCRATAYKKPEYLFTLSVVYGAIPRLDEAIALAEKAVALAKAAGNSTLAESITRRREAYVEARAKGVSPLDRLMPDAMRKPAAPEKPDNASE